MQSVRSLFKATPLIKSAIQPQRNMSVISAPARTKVSTGEMIGLASLMVISWTAIPIWVLVNIKNYRGSE